MSEELAEQELAAAYSLADKPIKDLLNMISPGCTQKSSMAIAAGIVDSEEQAREAIPMNTLTYMLVACELDDLPPFIPFKSSTTGGKLGVTLSLRAPKLFNVIVEQECPESMSGASLTLDPETSTLFVPGYEKYRIALQCQTIEEMDRMRSLVDITQTNTGLALPRDI
jgi:hypothetical protein